MQTTLQAFSPAKINLFLHVTGQRQDGYHLIESIMTPVSLGDNIHLKLTEKEPKQPLTISKSGDLAHLPNHIDLTFKACELFFKTMGNSPPVHIQIQVKKQIPEQAGLGGGSSNAAQILLLLQKHFGNPLNDQQLNQLALSLGADVPFFLQPNAAFIEGIGEKITPVKLPDLPLIVYKPPQNCPTRKIFQAKELTRNKSTVKIPVFDLLRTQTKHVNHAEQSLQANINNFWQFLNKKTENSLQSVVALYEPEWLGQLNLFERSLQSNNPLLVRMTGSGSAIFALFDNKLSQQLAYEQIKYLPGHVFCCHALSSGVNSG